MTVAPLHKFATTLLCVPPESVPTLWPRVSDMIDAAYESLDEITPDVLPWLVEKKGLLWIEVLSNRSEIVAAATTSLVPMRKGLACRVVAVGGGAFDLWREHLEQIKAYARSEGCYKIVVDGRPGWARALPNAAVKAVSIEIEV